jgi:tetratricopeptide (TPR) repeat protein
LAPRVAALLTDATRLLDRRDYAGADRVLTGARVLAAAHPEMLRLDGLLRHRQGRLAEAAELYRRALATRPDDAQLLGQFGELMTDMGDGESAVDLLRRACALAPADTNAWMRLGLLLDRRALHEEALVSARRIVELAPGHLEGRLLAARNLQALGRIDEAAVEYRRLIALGGERAYQAWFSLVDMKTVPLDAGETTALERLHADAALPDPARAALGFALGRVYEDAGRYAEAFATLTRANALVRRGIQWDTAASSREIDGIMAAFSTPAAQAREAIGEEAIFIVGLPRSSTTLIEQILAVHPDIEGASELPDLPATITGETKRRGVPFAAWAAAASAADWERLGREYLARTARWRKQRPRSTDKLPNNWILVGAIRAMLPGAKIIDCRRDPLETCWSCYKQLFAPGLVRYAYDLGELGAQWRDYDRLSRFWAERHPQHVRVQDYETLLSSPAQEIRALVEFCGLRFDERFLRFHEAARGVRSASAGQVRQPLRTDTSRAQHYGALLDPLRRALQVPGF